MGPMTSAVIEAQLATAAKPETAARIAAFKSNLYQALLQRGFNNEDAMRIVVTTPLPGASPAAK
jgi:SOS response regulatory protein OraA/RecX